MNTITCVNVSFQPVSLSCVARVFRRLFHVVRCLTVQRLGRERWKTYRTSGKHLLRRQTFLLFFSELLPFDQAKRFKKPFVLLRWFKARSRSARALLECFALRNVQNKLKAKVSIYGEN